MEVVGSRYCWSPSGPRGPIHTPVIRLIQYTTISGVCGPGTPGPLSHPPSLLYCLVLVTLIGRNLSLDIYFISSLRGQSKSTVSTGV